MPTCGEMVRGSQLFLAGFRLATLFFVAFVAVFRTVRFAVFFAVFFFATFRTVFFAAGFRLAAFFFFAGIFLWWEISE